MSAGYQRSDAHIVDYQLYALPGVEGFFRGPAISSAKYAACVGAAQTFGRFVQAPYPALLARTLGFDVLNLGRGGAGPSFPLSNNALLGFINGARLVVVQILSGRSQSNSLFRIAGHGLRGVRVSDGQEMSADQFYTWLMGEDTGMARRIVAETRANYVAAMRELLDAIRPPKVLLWFSVRGPEYNEYWELPLWRLWGEFPQFVNREMLDGFRDHADAYVECISRAGLPQRLIDQSGNPSPVAEVSLLTGEIAATFENRYYPSPEMHEEAAARLIPVCREMLHSAG